MSKARLAIQKRIQRRVQANRKDKESKTNPKKMLKECLKILMDELPQSKNASDFYSTVSHHLTLLHNRLTAIDPKVNIHTLWDGDEHSNKYDELHIKGLKIEWSIVYMAHHMKESKEVLITVTDLWLEEE